MGNLFGRLVAALRRVLTILAAPLLIPLRDMLAELFEGLLVPLRAVAVALLGVWLAEEWSSGRIWPPVIVSLVVIGLGYLCDFGGRHLLPDHPVAAVVLLEFWMLAPLVVAAMASALIVLLAIHFTVPSGASPTTTELTKALSTALTAFLTSGFVAWTGDQNASPVAQRIQRTFAAKYQRCVVAPQLPQPGIHYFRPDSPGERWVLSDSFGGIDGWGYEARRTRARGIARELAHHTSDCPSLSY